MLVFVKAERRDNGVSDHRGRGGLSSHAAANHRRRNVSHISETRSAFVLQGVLMLANQSVL